MKIVLLCRVQHVLQILYKSGHPFPVMLLVNTDPENKKKSIVELGS